MRTPKMFGRNRGRKKYYYVVIKKKHIPLGTDKQKAEVEYHRLMLARREKSGRDRFGIVESPTVAQIATLFLDHVHRHRSERTYRDHRNYLRSFVGWIPGGIRIDELRRHDVTQWLDANPQWHTSGRRGAITSLKRCLNWALEEEIIERNPIGSYRKPKPKRRETILSPEQQELILEECSDQLFRDFVTVLLEQGMRPEEMRSVEARHVQLDQSVIVFPADEHKTGQRTERARVVYLTDKSLHIIRRLVAQHPTGPIFRNRAGNPWTRSAVHCRFFRMRRRLNGKLPPNLGSYVFRHTYCTDAIEAGPRFSTRLWKTSP